MTKIYPQFNSNVHEDDGRWYVQLWSQLPCRCRFGASTNNPHRAAAEQKAFRLLHANAATTRANCIARRIHRR